MKFIKNNWFIFLIFILIFSLSFYFPLTSKDLYWYNLNNINGILDFYKFTNGNLLSGLISIILTKNNLIKMLTYSILTISLFYLIKNIVNKKNSTLFYIGFFLYLIMGSKVFSSSYVWITGFSISFLSVLLILNLINIQLKNLNKKINLLFIFLLGLTISLIDPIISLFILITTSMIIIYKLYKKNQVKNINYFLLGCFLGDFIIYYFNYKNKVLFLTKDFSKNILHMIIPDLYSINFLITLIFISFLFFLSIKIFIKGSIIDRRKSLLTIICITVYALTFLLINNDIIRYISYILFQFSSIFILLHANSSMAFKKKMKLYYFYKLLYLFVISFSSQYNSSFLLFPLVIDIIILLDLMNYIFPNNFLHTKWQTILVLVLVSNIYLYRDTYYKNQELNNFLTHHLECSMIDFKIPSKYDSKYLYNPVPLTMEDKYNFITKNKIKIDGYVYEYLIN